MSVVGYMVITCRTICMCLVRNAKVRVISKKAAYSSVKDEKKWLGQMFTLTIFHIKKHTPIRTYIQVLAKDNDHEWG